MTPIEGQPILTAAQTRAAEERAISGGTTIRSLMQSAGEGVAAAVHRLAAGGEVLVLCGPGNNGGDGYVAAEALRRMGRAVRVAASGEPKGEAAVRARAEWGGAVEDLDENTPPAPVLVDAVFGTGLNRALDPALLNAIGALTGQAGLRIAVDLPSGVETDSGAELTPGCTPEFDVTLALGAPKPAHVLQPAAALCGTVRVIGIGLACEDAAPVRATQRPSLVRPRPSWHKYSRGMVAVVSGPMHGASELAARAAYGAGAGYVLLLTGGLPQPPHAIVRRKWSAGALDDPRVGAVVIGPGLGRDDRAREKLAAALATDHPLVIDGDALHLLDPDRLRARTAATVLTPHAGEFEALFGKGDGSKIARAQAAAAHSGATVVFKGADTVVARPDGWANVAPPASPWLSVAGTGDVLAGAIGTILAQMPHDPLAAASAGVWLHAEAARVLGGCFIADDLAEALPQALARAR